MDNLAELERKIGISFKNKNLIREAITHRSYLNECPNQNLKHNERLEFLGDAVLELIVTDYLFRKMPESPEGMMTGLRASLVKADSLIKVAHKIDLDKFILVSKGESKDKSSKGFETILANAVEAIIGAIYLDSGFAAAKKFVEENILIHLEEIIRNKEWKDAKSLFQELSQAELEITPKYKILKEWGPDHNKKFLVGLYLDDKLISKGKGSSKQEAEIEAAKEALTLKKEKGWSI